MAAEQSEDFYAILGVPRSATADDVKKAYRKLARKHHPDLNPGNKQAEERFKQISRAHDVLSDPEQRKLYDEFGSVGLHAGFDAARARKYAGAADFGDSGGRGGFGRYARFEDIFGEIFGEPSQPGGPARGRDLESEIAIAMLDAIRGLATTIDLQPAEACATCAGSGQQRGAGASTCPECGGRGQVRTGHGPIAMLRTCPRCAGAGQIGMAACAACSGRGQTLRNERLAVRIPAGVDDGSRVRVAGKGGAGLAGGPPGDLFLVVRIKPHPLLERRGHDLYLEVPVTVREAALGATITVPTPDGELRVKVPPGSQSGRQLRLRGHGVPVLGSGGRGDLYLRLMVQVPPAEQAERVQAALDAIEGAYQSKPRAELRF
ncbi:MAG: molecular chaperone DnaJ [Deltaproteobacteria bacterium]|nr:molecular chaperone DnaJ [Deltaproteobacteria bacterium]